MMKSLLKPNDRLPPVRFRLVIVVLLVIGIFFRFTNIDRKIYWHDEAFTSLRISGYTVAEVVGDVIDNREVDIKYLQKYQRLKPESRLIDTLNSLAIEDPQHPPLYYVIALFWMQRFGNSVGAIRSLTAIASLLVFPCAYWLCLELFASHLVGWVAVGLFAVSPVHVLFAQEAREYCLWTITILLFSAALLRALRLNNFLNWGIYTISLALSLYTFLLSGVVAVGHSIYVIVVERLRLNRAIAYLLTSLTGILIFIPWLLTTIFNFPILQATTGWTSVAVPNSILVQKWVLHISRIFFDLDVDVNRGFITYLPIFVILLLIVGYAIYFLCSTTSHRVWLFILTLFGATALFLIVPDLIQGGQRSIVPRYLFPCYLGIQLAVAYLLAIKINSTSFWQQKIWQLVMILLLSGGVTSCIVSSQAETWWIKDISYKNPQIARVINQTTHPLLIGYAGCSNNGNLISLSYLLEPKVRLQFVLEPNIPQVSDRFSNVFLFGECSERSRARLENERGYKLEPILQNFWQIKNWQNRKEG